MPYNDPDKQRAAQRKCYRRHTKDYTRRRNEFRRKKKLFLDWIKSSIGCQRCGFNEHPSALDFHHVDGKDKGMTTLGAKDWGPKKIQKEIMKCVVHCANCHRITHLA